VGLAFIVDEGGAVANLSIVDVDWVKDEKGRQSPRELPDTLFVVHAD